MIIRRALDLGDDTLQRTLDERWTRDVGEMVEGFQLMLPAASVADLSSLARSIRREMLGALIEREVDIEVARADLRKLIGAHVDSLEASAAAWRLPRGAGELSGVGEVGG